MALTPDTDQFSQFLRLAFLRSPNFVSGSTGWTINQDGSVEFNNGTFRGVLEAGRLFIYNGTPAAGNLIGSISGTNAPDRFGNSVVQGIASYDNTFGNTGQLNGAGLSMFAGVNKTVALTPSGLTIFNSHGATIFALDETRDAFFLYADTGSASQGALIASMAQGSGTDSFGNAFKAGVNAYVTVTGLFAGTYAISLNDQTQAWGANVAALFFQNLTHAPTIGPAVTGQAHNTAGCNVNVQSGKSTAGAVGATVQVQDSVSSSQAGGLVDVLAGALEAILPDGNTYRTERLTLPATATPQTISSTSPTTITGCSAPVGAVKYAFKARVTFSGGVAAGTANFSVTGPANTGAWINAIFLMTNSSGAGAQNAALGPVNSPTLTTGNNVADIEGEVTFTASGTVALAVAEGTAGDTVIIQKAHFWLYPM